MIDVGLYIIHIFVVQTLFSPFEVLEAVELTLGGDMVLSDMKLLKWNYSHQDSRSRSTKHNGC